MTGPCLLDAGPLVALLDRSDHFHQWAVGQFRQLSTPFVTCEAVLTEACYLLRRVDAGHKAVLGLMLRQTVRIAFQLTNELAAVGQLAARYADVPMSLADACLVRMCELHPKAQVFTLDRDFRMYRKNRRQIIPVVMPDTLHH